MTALALFLLLQTAASPTPPLAPKQWSILQAPCAAASDDQGKDIVVCGHPDAITPRLPLPQFRGPPDHPVPSNPDLSAAVALDGPSGRGECGAYGEACPVAGGGYVVPKLVAGAIDLAQNGFKKRHYKDKGVSIPLDDPPADTAGRLLP
ncbi:hypothetical protein [uncultured Sphingomonas sp.]|uniref:hypothetical protein n=1 Tax=uncultured Sphingomonas sp. TaxID=158754 RepID=UPI0035CB2FD7